VGCCSVMVWMFWRRRKSVATTVRIAVLDRLIRSLLSIHIDALVDAGFMLQKLNTQLFHMLSRDLLSPGIMQVATKIF
jgi:hypothetical protein